MNDSVENGQDEAVQAAHETLSKARATEDATFEGLMSKPRRVSEFFVTVPAEGGGIRKLKVRYRALDPNVYDELVEAHPPTKSERDKGAFFNKDTFPPALISAVCITPKMTVSQASDLWNNPDWSPGELQELFVQAQRVNGGGLDVPFNGAA